MTKRRASSPMRQLSRWRSRLISILSVLLRVLAFLRVFHSQANLQSSFPTSRRRSRAFIDKQFDGSPKVAFLFLVRWDLPLDFFWGTFFKVCFLVLVPFMAVCSKLKFWYVLFWALQNGDAAKFPIYIHSKPGFVFDESTTMSALFFLVDSWTTAFRLSSSFFEHFHKYSFNFFSSITWFQDAFV